MVSAMVYSIYEMDSNSESRGCDGGWGHLGLLDTYIFRNILKLGLPIETWPGETQLMSGLQKPACATIVHSS